jgi:WD40 repeat protein
MSGHEDFYTAEQVDEQVDVLLQGQYMPKRDLHMAHDLRSILATMDGNEDEDSLRRVLFKLLNKENAQHLQNSKVISFSDFNQPLQMKDRVVPLSETIKQSPKISKVKPIRLVFSTFAAILAAMVLAGSMLLVINIVHQRQANKTPGIGSQITATLPPTSTPAPQLDEGKIVYTSPLFDVATSAIWSPDGSRVAVAVNRTTVESWDAMTGANVLNYTISGDVSVTNVAWSPNGKMLAVSGSSTIYLFDAKTAKQIYAFPSSNLAFNSTTGSTAYGTNGNVPLNSLLPQAGASYGGVVWSPNGRYVATVWNGYYQNRIIVWDATTGLLFKSLTSSSASFLSLHWSHNENLLAALYIPIPSPQIGALPAAEILDTTNWTVVKQYSNVYALDWSPDGKQLALVDTGQSGGKDVRIVDALTGQQIILFADTAGLIYSIYWSPDGSSLAVEYLPTTSSSLLSISIWSITSGTQLYKFQSNSAVDRFAWSTDSKYVSCSQTVGSKTTGYQVNILVFVA